MATQKEKFEKILQIISPLFIALNDGQYADTAYRIMSIEPFLKELRAEITPQKSCLEYGVIKLIYLENRNRLCVLTESIDAWRFARIIGQTLLKEKIKHAVVLRLYPRKQKGE